jgi:alpha-1,2-mannosyltransferase
MVVLIFSTGMFNASVAYLPSSFAMYTTMLGMAAFMDVRDGWKTARGILWFAIGGLIGWPFSMALVAPFLVEEVFVSFRNGEFGDFINRVFHGAVQSVLLLVCFIHLNQRIKKLTEFTGNPSNHRFMALPEGGSCSPEHRLV